MAAPGWSYHGGPTAVPGAFLLAKFQYLGGTLMIDQILEAVRQAWPALEIDWPVPNHMYYILQSRARVVFFLFAPDNTHHPLVVVKMSRDPVQNHTLAQSVEQALPG